jgi:hypothetical protein
VTTLSSAPVALLVVLAGCSAWGNKATSEIRSPRDRAAAGQHFGFITNGDAAKRTITFDSAQWLDGEEGRRAAVEDGAIGSNESLSNDYYIRNAETQTRVLELAPDAEVIAAVPVTSLAVRPPASCRNDYRCTSYPVSSSSFFASFKAERYRGPWKFWLTIRDGLVVRFDEQYVP